MFIDMSALNVHCFIRFLPRKKERKTAHFDWDVCELNMFLKLTLLFPYGRMSLGSSAVLKRLRSTSGAFQAFQVRFPIKVQPNLLGSQGCYFSILCLESSRALPCWESGIFAGSVHGILWLWQEDNKPSLLRVYKWVAIFLVIFSRFFLDVFPVFGVWWFSLVFAAFCSKALWFAWCLLHLEFGSPRRMIFWIPRMMKMVTRWARSSRGWGNGKK